MKILAPLLTILTACLTISQKTHAESDNGTTPPITYNEKKVHPARFLLKTKPSQITKGYNAIQSLGGGTLEEYRNLPNLTLLELSTPLKELEYPTALETLKKSGAFQIVEPDYMVSLQSIPNDSAYQDGTLWGLKNRGTNGGTLGIDINVEPAWSLTKGEGVVVGVIDTGVRYTHQDLAPNMWKNPKEIADGKDTDGNGYVDDIYGINAITNSGNPMDDHGHGTHVAGTIAGVEGGGPLVGVAPRAKIMALKFLGSWGYGYYSDAVKCVNYATAHGAHMTSNSWGGSEYSEILYDAIANSTQSGLLFIAAAGNAGSDIHRSPAYPAAYDLPDVIGVASIDRIGALSPWSNYGNDSLLKPLVELAAPGASIYSATSFSDQAYATWNGTSMAAPHVTGVLTLLRAKYPEETNIQIQSRLFLKGKITPAIVGKTTYGVIPDAHNALLGPAPTPIPTPTPTPIPTPTPPPIITSPTSATAKVNEQFTYQITASAPPTVWGVKGLPEGFRFASKTGTIYGIPNRHGNHTLLLEAYYLNTNYTARSPLSLEILATPPIIGGEDIHQITPNQYTTYRIQAFNNPTSYQAENLPPGLRINTKTGLIAGTPTKEARTTLSTIFATNPAGTGSKSITFLAPEAPTFISPTNSTARIGTFYSFRIKASGRDNIYSASKLPKGLQLNKTSGYLSGMAQEDGTFQITLRAQNKLGRATQILTLQINPTPPQIANTKLYGQVGKPFKNQIIGRNLPKFYQIPNKPNWMQINPRTGTLSGTPTEPLKTTITLVAQNAAGTTEKTIPLEIVPKK